MTWLWHDITFTQDDVPKDAVGFVYCITHLESGKRYIGQKRLQRNVVRAPLKGQKRKRRSVIPSDWMTYWGSSDYLKDLVLKEGPQAFKREILHICFSKGMLNYTELQEQINRRVLFDESYINGIVQVRINKSHVINSRPNLSA